MKVISKSTIYFIRFTNTHTQYTVLYKIHLEASLFPHCVLSVTVLHVEPRQEGDVGLQLPGVTSYPLPCRGLVFIS